MTRVGFYHLTRTTPDAALPELLGRTLAEGERAVVQCGSEARVAELDKALWAAATPDWLPHGSARTGHAALQPIWLTAAPVPAGAGSPNGAQYLFLLDGVEASPAGWVRVFDLFDGADALAVAAARRRWTLVKEAGCTTEYWRQGEMGWARG